jgi:hypothetical protein
LGLRAARHENEPRQRRLGRGLSGGPTDNNPSGRRNGDVSFLKRDGGSANPKFLPSSDLPIFL